MTLWQYKVKESSVDQKREEREYPIPRLPTRPSRTHRTLASRKSGHCCHLCQPLSFQNTDNFNLNMFSHSSGSMDQKANTILAPFGTTRHGNTPGTTWHYLEPPGKTWYYTWNHLEQFGAAPETTWNYLALHQSERT